MIRLGVLLLIVVLVGFVVIIVIPDALAPVESLLCQPGEHLVTNQTTYSSSPGETTTTNEYYCATSDGATRDVTGQIMPVIVIGFVVLLLVSLALMAVGSKRLNQTPTQSMSGLVSPSLSTPGGTKVSVWNATNEGAMLEDMVTGLEQGVLRFGGKEIPLSELKGGAYQHLVTAEDKHTLAETLRQLSEAHNQGLITDDEYQHLRQEALDKLV